MDSFQPIRMKVEGVVKEDHTAWEALNTSLFVGPEVNVNARKKRFRSSNFSKEETDLLLKICSKYGDILENKRTDKATNLRKMKVWRAISLEFNYSIPNIPMRDAKSLKFKYDQVRKDLKRSLKNEPEIPETVLREDQIPRQEADNTTEMTPQVNDRTKHPSSVQQRSDEIPSLRDRRQLEAGQVSRLSINEYQIELLQIQIDKQRAENVRLQELHEARKLILYLEIEKLKAELFLLKNTPQRDRFNIL